MSVSVPSSELGLPHPTPLGAGDCAVFSPAHSPAPEGVGWGVGYSDYDVFLENDEGSRVYRCKKDILRHFCKTRFSKF